MASADVGILRRERDRDRDRDHDRDRYRGREHRHGPSRRDGGDSYRPGRRARPRTPPPLPTEEQKQAAAKAEYEKLLTMRSGGTYIPPARLRALQSQITDKTSKEYQRMAWEALKKSINGLINKVHTANIKHIVPELFGENLIRGRGLFCRSIMKAQAASLPFTPIYASMAAIVNTKLPQVGELLIKRLVMQFRKGFKRNDKSVCLSSTTFLAHLINQQVQHEMLAGQILLLLLNKPTDDSVEIAVGFCREVGQFLEEMRPAIANVIFDQFRNILHEAGIDKRTQYMVEVLFQVRKDRYKDNPAVKEELDLVEEEDQITHQVELDGEANVQDGLNVFKFDEEYEENEEAYKRLKAEILGEASGDEEDDDDDDDGSDDSSDEEDDQETKTMEIKDQSNADLVNLRRTIYLTIMSSADPEEATHKLIKINLPAGQEAEMPSMIVECCSQEKTYTKFFGLIAERFAKINRLWCDLFEQSFEKYYETIHRYENNKLRNIAMLFGHMFGADALGWHCMSVIHLNEEETTSSSRIFIKILFQSIVEEIGLPKLKERMTDEVQRSSFEGLFPRDSARNVRFSINYFTSIGLGALTEEMREFLQKMPKPALPAPAAHEDEDDDDDSVSSFSSYTGSSYSRSRSPRSPRSKSRSPSPSRSRSPGDDGDRRGRWLSRTPSRRRRSPSYSRSGTGSASYSSDGRSVSDAGGGSGGGGGRRRQRRRRLASYSASPPGRGRSGRKRDGGSYSRSRSRSLSPYSDRSRSRSISQNRLVSPRRGRRSSAARGTTGRLRDQRRNSSSVSSRSRSRSPRRTEARGPSDRRGQGRLASYDSRSPSRSRSAPRQPQPARRGKVDDDDDDDDGGGGRTPRSNGRLRSRSSCSVLAKRRRGESGSSASRSPMGVKRGRRGS